PSAKGDDKFITTDYLQQCRTVTTSNTPVRANSSATIQWRNPLAICRIRTHGLRSARSAIFGSSVRIGANGAPRAHQRVDIAAEPGTPIYAVADGRVTFITNRGGWATIIYCCSG
ncbi:M23 family metallopeptidase, partial [Enterobacter roggenkampii]